MPDEIPNSPTPPASNEPSNEAVEPKMPMGTIPTRQRNQQPQAPTTPPAVEPGTEGEKAPATPPEQGQGNDPEDYKTKFSESSKEALRLLDVLKAHGIDPATGQPIAPAAPAEEPTRPAIRGDQPQQPEIPLTDDQLSKAIPGFANLTEQEKVLIRDTKATVKQIAELKNFVAEIYDEREYGKQFKTLTSKEQWKPIAEHAEEFKEYAYKPENLQTPMETLAASFLYNKGLASKPKPTPPAPSGLEPGSGGGKGDGKTDKDGFSAEELATIRTTDPKRYANLAKSGKLKLRG